MFRNIKKKFHEEGLALKVESVTDNGAKAKKHNNVRKLLEASENVDDANLIFSVMRARITDGLTYGRHWSIIKCVCLLELFAEHGPLVIIELLPSFMPYLEKIATYYCTEVDSATFEPLFDRICDFIDTMKESNKKKENEKGIQINEAINQCLSGMVSMISTIDDNMKKAKGLKTKTTGNLLATGDKSAPVQEQELTSMIEIAVDPDQDGKRALSDIAAKLSSKDGTRSNINVVFKALKEALFNSLEDPGNPALCKKVFEALQYLKDKGIVGQYAIPKEDVEYFASEYVYEVDGKDLGIEVRKLAATYLNVEGGSRRAPELVGGVDLGEVGIALGTLSRFDGVDNRK